MSERLWNRLRQRGRQRRRRVLDVAKRAVLAVRRGTLAAIVRTVNRCDGIACAIHRNALGALSRAKLDPGHGPHIVDAKCIGQRRSQRSKRHNHEGERRYKALGGAAQVHDFDCISKT